MLIAVIPGRFEIFLWLLMLCVSFSGCVDGLGVDEQEDTCPESDQALLMPDLLSRINAARADGRSCGSNTFASASPVVWNDQLARAARHHSDDMATHDFFDHKGTDGKTVADRVTDAGYTWKLVAENLLVGTDSIEGLIDEWLKSPGHCQNIMNPEITEIGAAAVTGTYKGRQAMYWTLVLAAPACE